MNVLFLSISSLPNISEHSISLDLIHEFIRNGHSVYVVCALEKKCSKDTYESVEAGCRVLRVKTGNNKKASLLEKGITTISLPYKYINAIKKYYSDVKFDLVLYPTPPVTQAKTVKYIKNRDGAKTYLLLKDIFPQNAVDLNLLTKTGVKSLLYMYFRFQEKKLYYISDNIGCMSPANVDYLLGHNHEISKEKVEVCPNCIEITNTFISKEERKEIRDKYGIPQDKIVFVYGGNLGKPQGIPYIIDCLRMEKENQDVFFLVVGDGTEYAKLEKFIKSEMPLNVKLMASLPKEDYDRLILACDVGMIFLDYRFTIPNFPSRLLSYMQASLPVLACTDENTDIRKVIIDNGFGWWCASNNVTGFDEKVKLICSEDLERMGNTSKNVLSKMYSVDYEYEKILHSIKG